MTKQEKQRRARLYQTLINLGFTDREADQLRRISNTLQSWYEMECGNDKGSIERDPVTDKPYFTDESRRHRYAVTDREKGALKRLKGIITSRPHLTAYIQGDPRGAALYILRPDDVPEGCSIASCYTRGICVY